MRRELIIVGTLHAGLTPNHELRGVLERFIPDQLLVEITKSDLRKKNFSKYPPEMVHAYRWARKHKRKVDGMDSSINEVRPYVSKKQLKRADSEALKLLKRHRWDWKDANKRKVQDFLDHFYKGMFDQRLVKKRNKEMVANIRKSTIKHGTIIILTGAGHLKYFEKYLRNALFPFRSSTANYE